MQAGDLDIKITIREDTTDGTVPAVWADLYTDIWANRKAFRGTAFYGAAADQEKSNVVYTVRWTAERAAGIKAKMQILDGNRTLEIQVPPVDALNGKQWLEIFASELTQNGG